MIELVGQGIHRHAHMRERRLELVFHIRQILDTNPIFTAQDNRPLAFHGVEILIHIEQKDILELQSFGLVNRHELHGILWQGHFHICQVVIAGQKFVNHGNKTRQALETGLFKIIGS
ncbi:Uncharacterised protein [Chlamydia trachomatis]|nr:Uncharacterised protein [Chlamydia trachomatis]